MSTDQITRRIIVIRPLQVYFYGYFNFYELIFTIKLIVSGTVRILSTIFFFLLWRCDPTRVMTSSFWRFLDHTQRRSTVGRTHLDEWSARRRDLYLTAHNTHNTQLSMPPGGIRTHDLSRRAAADQRLRPRGYWDRPYQQLHLNVVTLSLSTPSRECQPTSVSEHSFWASFSAASIIRH